MRDTCTGFNILILLLRWAVPCKWWLWDQRTSVWGLTLLTVLPKCSLKDKSVDVNALFRRSLYLFDGNFCGFCLDVLLVAVMKDLRVEELRYYDDLGELSLNWLLWGPVHRRAGSLYWGTGRYNRFISRLWVRRLVNVGSPCPQCRGRTL